MQQLVVIVVLLSGVCIARPDTPAEPPSEFSAVREVLDKCPPGDSDLLTCFKLKAVRLLDRASRVNSLPIFDFVSVEKNSNIKDDPALPTGDALEASLPRDLQQKSTALDKILMEKLWSYFNSRTIKMAMPADVFEGREKNGLKLKKGGKKNGGMMMMMVGAMGGMMLKLALAKIALIAGKALVIGKIALLLAAVLAFKSLMSQGHEEKHTSQVIYAEPEMHGGWSRTAAIPEAAHDLAYWGQRSFRSRQVGTTSTLPA